MKRNLLLFLLLPLWLNAAAQHSYMAGKHVAVFEPAGYDATQHEPSPIFVAPLRKTSAVAPRWAVRPQFSTTAEGHSVAEISIGEGTDLYGTGEVYGDLRRNGDTQRFWNKDNGAYAAEDGKRLYQTHPWVLGVRPDGTAFGILADNTWKSSVTTDATVRFESYGPPFRVVVIEHDSPDEVLRELARLSGTMELPPLWALGYQQCRYSYCPDTKVKEIADELRARQIPCDVVWMDIDYMDGFRVFTFSPTAFPDPKGLNDYLHAKNLKAVYMIDPGVKVDPGYFADQSGTENDCWVKDKEGNTFVGKVWPGMCHFPDFTRPHVRAWWASLYKDFMAQGVDGVWNDMNEPAVFDGPDNSMPEDNLHMGGDGLQAGPHLRYHNQYGFNMVRASRQGILAANPDKRPFLLTRSNCLGGHRYAATWTGDNSSSVAHMRGSIPMSLNLGLSGQPFSGPDIGGFLDNCTPELLAQWTAMGIYFPFTRNHSCVGTAQQEPWAFGPEVEGVCRTAINRRYRLLPYIYTLFRQASTEGLPVMRPTFMADAKDRRLRGEQESYLLGGDVLVVPRWREGASPLPTWQPMPLEDSDDGYQARLYQRPGSIVPMAKLCQSTVDYNLGELTLLVCLDSQGKATSQLYEDSGDGFGYRQGDYALSTLRASQKGSRLRVALRRTAGRRATGIGRWRVGIVQGGTVTYTDWATGASHTFDTSKNTNR